MESPLSKPLNKKGAPSSFPRSELYKDWPSLLFKQGFSSLQINGELKLYYIPAHVSHVGTLETTETYGQKKALRSKAGSLLIFPLQCSTYRYDRALTQARVPAHDFVKPSFGT